MSTTLPEGLTARDPADAALSETVAALREEISGLRAAAGTRAVIELATGVLVERHQISPDEAFTRLRALSQEHNVGVREVAATVVGIAVPTVGPQLSDVPKDLLCEPLPLGNAATAHPELEWLSTLLRLNLDPWLLLDTVPSADGVVRDLVVEDVTQQLSDGTELIGRRLLETWPCLEGDGTALALTTLARSGGSWTTTVANNSAAPWGIPGSRIRAVRLGRRIVLVWRPGRTADRRSPAAQTQS